MKSLKILIASAALLAACVTASAQYVVGAPNVFASYSPTNFVVKEGGSISESLNSVAAGVSSSMAISSLPLAFEYGAEVQYSWRNDHDVALKMLGIKAPVSILYNFEFPSAPISFVPLAGIDLGVYALGKIDDEDIFTEYWDEKLSRFIFNWHIGAKVCFKQFSLGVTYESPITCMYNKDGLKIFNNFTNISLGIRF